MQFVLGPVCRLVKLGKINSTTEAGTEPGKGRKMSQEEVLQVC